MPKSSSAPISTPVIPDASFSPSPTPSVKRGGNTLIIVLSIIFILALIVAVYFYKQSQFLESDPQRITDEKVATLVAKVGKLVVLPTGEVPTVAEISDPTKLVDQPFFKNVKAGNQVIFYTGARKIIIYDPVANIVVDIATLNIGE